MAVKTGDTITVSFTTQRFDTGAATNADSLPTGTLYLNGISNAATVTVTNTTTGQYRAAVTLPTLTTGDRCEIAIAATVNSVAGRGIVWRDACDIATDSTGRVTVGSNADKTGYALTQAFPANFASLGINSSGHVSRVTLVDTTTTNTDMRGTDGAALASVWTSSVAARIDENISTRLASASYTAPLTSGQTASAVWDSLLTGYTVSGSFGQRLTRSDSSSAGNGIKITGSGHVASVLHDAEPDSIPEDAFVTGALSARVIGADAITAAKVAADVGAEIATAVRAELSVELARIDQTVGSRSTLTATQAADAVLTRGAANVETTAEAYSITDMLLGVFESKVEAGTWTIYRSDGTTTHRTKTITTDAGAEPITRVQ